MLSSPDTAVITRLLGRWDAAHGALDSLTESYYEVLSPPFGEGLVGKKFLHPFFVGCRADGGEEWCRGEEKRWDDGGSSKRP